MRFHKKKQTPELSKTKKSTNKMIDAAVSRQSNWMARRSAIASSILHTLNIFAKTKTGAPAKPKKKTPRKMQSKTRHWLLAYWFPILCAAAVILMLIYVIVVPRCLVTPTSVPEPTIQPVVTIEKPTQVQVPTFDMVRIDKNGKIIVAGRWLPSNAVSIKINGKMVATEQTNDHGEFVYSPTKVFPAGNYAIRLSGVEQNLDSTEDVFVYVSQRGTDSMSLLMAKDGSRFLQKPKLQSGDLNISKIDYLENGRIVVQGSAIPRTRVTMTLDGQPIGMAHVSDHKNFGIGANVGTLEPGREYVLRVRMHDGSGRAAAAIRHKFTMPQMQPGDDTWYMVRRDDSLWIIARNFLGRGIRYTMIAEKNNIENPDLIYPKQKLQIPVNDGK